MKMNTSLFVFLFIIVTLCWVSSAAATEKRKKKKKQPPPRVLIIGSGINGAATAFFLQNLHLREPNSSSSSPITGEDSLPFNITVVERNDRIGGRVFGFAPPSGKKKEHDDDDNSYIELGASVYHSINRHMTMFAAHAAHAPITKASSVVLEKKKWSPADHKTHPYLSARLGVFDGDKFVFREQPDAPLALPFFPPALNIILGRLWAMLVTAYRGLSRYGMDAIAIPTCVDAMVEKLEAVYNNSSTTPLGLESKGYRSAEAMLRTLNLLKEAQSLGAAEFFAKHCRRFNNESRFTRGPFYQEIMHGIMRLNYGQSDLSALAAGVALKGKGGSVAFRGGNHQIIKALFHLTDSNVLLGTNATVDFSEQQQEEEEEQQQSWFGQSSSSSSSDKKKKKKRSIPKVLINGADRTRDFDLVFIAHPRWSFQQDVGDEQQQQQQQEQKQPSLPGFVTHVTIVEAAGLNASFFGFSSEEDDGEEMPSIIVTSRDVLNKTKKKEKVFFRSIGKLRSPASSSTSSALFKIFSDEAISIVRLRSSGVFLPISSSRPVEIVYAHEWRAAYPVLKETSDTESETRFVLSAFNSDFSLPLVIHAGALERYVSTLETQAISARNAVDLAKRRLLRRSNYFWKMEKEREKIEKERSAVETEMKTEN